MRQPARAGARQALNARAGRALRLLATNYIFREVRPPPAARAVVLVREAHDADPEREALEELVEEDRGHERRCGASAARLRVRARTY